MNNILWTGGWDSTFRVLDLVLLKNKEVQPYYVVDPGRKSTKLELETMSKIKNMVAEVSPGKENLIKDLIIINKDQAPEDLAFTSLYRELYKITYLGPQYDWLGRCVKKLGLNNLELCVHKDDKAELFLANDVEEILVDGYPTYVLKEQPSQKSLEVFRNYHFPLIKMTKLEMAEISKNNGFDHIMEQTWFCHEPTADNQPCGVCNPCIYTREEGLGRRVPTPPFLKFIIRRIRSFAGRLKRLIKYK